MIQYIIEDVAFPPFAKTRISSWIKEVAASYNKKVGNISYIFCNDQRILEINRQYLKHDYYTDIITFDYTEGAVIAGDIFISVETVESNAQTFNVSFEAEIRRILIHGILHLCGQNDQTPALRAEMTQKENLALEMLQTKDL